MKRLSLSVMLSALVVAHGAHATEGGGSVYPTGAEGYLCCALPPPGLYALIYAEPTAPANCATTTAATSRRLTSASLPIR